jgi:hypothetical protein
MPDGASETHDVARWRFEGRSHEGKERGSRLRTRKGQQRRCTVLCRVQVWLTLEVCRETRNSPEDSAMRWDVEVEDAISGQRLFRRAEGGTSRMPAVGRVLS